MVKVTKRAILIQMLSKLLRSFKIKTIFEGVSARKWLLHIFKTPSRTSIPAWLVHYGVIVVKTDLVVSTAALNTDM